jgi:hypothetical protein
VLHALPISSHDASTRNYTKTYNLK